MLQVNSMIFPKPKRQKDLSYMKELWEYVVYIPKNHFRQQENDISINKNNENIAKSKSAIQDKKRNIKQDHTRQLTSRRNSISISISTTNILNGKCMKENTQQQQKQLQKEGQKTGRYKRQSLLIQSDFNIQSNRISKTKKNQSKLYHTSRQHNVHYANSLKLINQAEISPNINFNLNKTKVICKQNQFQGLKQWNNKTHKIPCLFIKCNNLINKGNILIYYHGNGQDLVSCYAFVKLISIYMNMDALIVQYPTYSIYNQSSYSYNSTQEGSPFSHFKYRPKQQHKNSFKHQHQNQTRQCTQNQIQNDSIDVIQHLIKLGYDAKNIILIGRSIGTGAVVNIATVFKVRAVILLSPFTSIKSVVQNMYGSLAGLLLKQRFNNVQKIKYIQSPVLIIHGVLDKLIPYQHALDLSKQVKGYCSVKLIANMSHSSFHYQKDFLVHLKQFIKMLGDQV